MEHRLQRAPCLGRPSFRSCSQGDRRTAAQCHGGRGWPQKAHSSSQPMHCSHRAGGWWDKNGAGERGTLPRRRRWRVALSRAGHPSPLTPLSLSLPHQRPGSRSGQCHRESPPALLGPCRDWRRCAALGTEAALSTPRAPATAHSQLRQGIAEGGCPGGTPEPPTHDRPLQAHTSNVDAWLLGRHRPSTSRHGPGGAVYSSQLVGLAREQGGLPTRAGATQSPCQRADAPRERAVAASVVSHRTPRRACRSASTPGRPNKLKGSAAGVTANQQQCRRGPERRGRGACRVRTAAERVGLGVPDATNAHWPEVGASSGVTGGDGNVGRRGWAQPMCRLKGALHVGARSGAHDGRAVQTRCLY